MKYILTLFLFLSSNQTVFCQKRVDSSLLFLKELNKRIISKHKLQDYVYYDFSVSEIDSLGRKKSKVFGNVSISKKSKDLKYIITNKTDKKCILYSNSNLLIVDNKKKTYTQLDSANKNIQKLRYENAIGLLEDFRLNTGISFVYFDSTFYAGISREGNSYLYVIKHIYNPKVINMVETNFLDTSTLFPIKKIFEYKIDGISNTSKEIWEISNVSFVRPKVDLFNEFLYTKSNRKIDEGTDLKKADTLALNSKAPIIKGIDVANNLPIETIAFKNKIVILDFWFVECPPCGKVNDVLKRIQTKYESKGVQIIGVNKNDDIQKIRIHLAKKKTTYLNIKVSEKLLQSYKVNIYPTLIFIDKFGIIKYVAKGFEPDLEAKLDDFISKEIDR
jgi:thiol-disulfide isomerase/thioredoxin